MNIELKPDWVNFKVEGVMLKGKRIEAILLDFRFFGNDGDMHSHGGPWEREENKH